jgi:hypothetical protein
VAQAAMNFRGQEKERVIDDDAVVLWLLHYIFQVRCCYSAL